MRAFSNPGLTTAANWLQRRKGLGALDHMAPLSSSPAVEEPENVVRLGTYGPTVAYSRQEQSKKCRGINFENSQDGVAVYRS